MTQPALTEDQLNQAKGIIATAADNLFAGNTITDADRAKATRLYGRVVSTLFDTDGNPTDEDVVRNNAILMIAAGAPFSDVVKYMIDCLSGNPVTAGDLLDDLGGTAEETDPDLADNSAKPAPATTTANAKPQGRRQRQRGGAK
jgi:hypothetical protein